jgi:hypothetical protein
VAVDIYSQTIHRTTQIQTNVVECRPCPVFASFTLAFALQLRKNHGKTSVRVRKTSISLRKTTGRIQYTCYQNTHTLQNPHKHIHYNPPPHTHTLQNNIKQIFHCVFECVCVCICIYLFIYLETDLLLLLRKQVKSSNNLKRGILQYGV